jgi:hypothetical protein
MSVNTQGSAPKTLNKTDIAKGASAFAWNLGSLLVAVVIAVVALPQDQLPEELYWIIPLAPLLNTVAYTFKRWMDDNR